MDTQVVEIIGQHYLIDQLLQSGIEVAVPVRDHGIDLVAYVDQSEFHATPIQVKVSSSRSFAIDRKYQKFPNLLLVYVWNVAIDEEPEVYALTYAEAQTVGTDLGWTKTESWKKGKYVTSSPSQDPIRALQEYRVEPGQWKERLTRGPVFRHRDDVALSG